LSGHVKTAGWTLSFDLPEFDPVQGHGDRLGQRLDNKLDDFVGSQIRGSAEATATADEPAGGRLRQALISITRGGSAMRTRW
jgi:hypothetical protein